MNKNACHHTNIPYSSALPRRLGSFDAVMIIVGDMIGVGAFVVTGIVSQWIHNPLWIMGLWIGGGVMALCGALTVAELGAMYPHSGGIYIYIRAAFGRFWGFMTGITYVLIIGPGSIAILAAALTRYMSHTVPQLGMSIFAVRPEVTDPVILTFGHLLSIGTIALFSLVQCKGIRSSARIQNVLSGIKIGAILFIGFRAFSSDGEAGVHIFSGSPREASGNSVEALALGMLCVFFAYTGWFASTFLAGEIRSPERTLPRSIITGTLLVTVLFVILNGAFIHALPVQSHCETEEVEELAIISLFGSGAAKAAIIVVVIFILGSLNGAILTSPRVLFAMARDGMPGHFAGRIHTRYGTPANAILLQGCLAAIFTVIGSLQRLVLLATIPMVFFALIMGLSVFRLRRTQPERIRPYRAMGYPWISGIFVVSCTVIMGLLCITRPMEASLGCGILIGGAALYGIRRICNRKYLRAVKEHIPHRGFLVHAIRSSEDHGAYSGH